VSEPGFAPELPRVDAWLLDAAALLTEPDPGPTPWLVENLIVDRALIAVAGRWKTTKSYGVLDICIAVATGRPAFGALAVPEPGRVVFVNEESGKAALWRRLDALCRGRGTNPEALRDRLFVAPNAGVKLDDKVWQSQLVAIGRRLEPRLFVFDPLARMKAPARVENEQSGMAPLIEYLRRLRNETGAGVLFVHHVGHTGEHMRGSSDLETAWETRLRWKRDGQASVVTIESEHREAEAAPPFDYRIAWDGLTRSMRFEAVDDPVVEAARVYLIAHPDASANDVYKALKDQGSGARKTTVLEVVKTIREGGSELGNHLGTTTLGQRRAGGSQGGLFEAPGTTPTDPPLEVVPDRGNHQVDEDEIERLAELAREVQA
jgi:hypothetical protein